MIVPTKRLQPTDDAFFVRIERRDQGSKYRRADDQQHDRREEQRHRIVAQPVEHRLPIAAHSRHRGGLLAERLERRVENGDVGHCNYPTTTVRHAGCADRPWTATGRRPDWWRRRSTTE